MFVIFPTSRPTRLLLHLVHPLRDFLTRLILHPNGDKYTVKTPRRRGDLKVGRRREFLSRSRCYLDFHAGKRQGSFSGLGCYYRRCHQALALSSNAFPLALQAEQMQRSSCSGCAELEGSPKSVVCCRPSCLGCGLAPAYSGKISHDLDDFYFNFISSFCACLLVVSIVATGGLVSWH